jgi:hypothetical protein
MWVVKLQLDVFLTLTLAGSEWSGACPSLSVHEEKYPNNYFIGDWVDPRDKLEAVAKRKIPTPGSNVTLITHPITSYYTN